MPRRLIPFAGGVLFLSALVLAAGCDSKVRTHPVEGKVVFRGNAGLVQRLEGGKVRFQSTTDPGLTAVGVLDYDGSFSMGTFLKEQGVSGVPAGEYRVRVEPPLDDDRKPRRGLLHARYQDFDRSGVTFRVPVSREVTIEVERPGR